MSGEAGEEGVKNEEGKETFYLESIASAMEVLIAQGRAQMKLLEVLNSENRLQGAVRLIQFGHMVILTITAGMVAINGVLMAIVLSGIAESSGWEQRLFMAFFLGLGVSLFSLLNEYQRSARGVRGMIQDWQKMEFGEDALREMLEREKAAKKGWLERLLGR